jgi:Ca2+-binding EF-hand superfamily protein
MFDAFDRDRSGTVSYDEFIRGVRGPMNPFRIGLVKQAFTKLDKTGDGVVDINDIKGVYNGKHHPDVISGKKTEDEILGEFLETFEAHHNLGGGRNDRSVTW